MKHYFIISLFSLCSLAAIAQSKISLNKDEKVKKEGELTGIMKGKEWIIQPKYDNIFVKHNHNSFILAKRGAISDVYYNTYSKKELLAEGLNDSQLQLFIIFYYGDNQAVFSGGKWGFKNSFTSVYPVYDSLFQICTINNPTDCDDVVGVKLNGQIGAISQIGKTFIPLGDYISIQYEFNNVAVGQHNFLGIATRKNGSRDFFAPYMNEFNKGGKLENFEPTYIAGKEGAEYFKSFWKELKAFRNAEGALGLITGKGKLFLPASAERINFQSVEITSNPEGGLKTNSDNFYLKLIKSDTVVISTLIKDIFFTDNTDISFQPEGLGEDFHQEKLTINYDYKIPLTEDFHCTLCKQGIVYWDETHVETKVIREEETVTKTSKVVWSELNEKGQFGTITTSYIIPAEVEKTIKSTPRSEVCGNCKGHVNFNKKFLWDESKQAFAGYYSYNTR